MLSLHSIAENVCDRNSWIFGFIRLMNSRQLDSLASNRKCIEMRHIKADVV